MSKLAHFFNAPEAGEDKERVDRQQSINTLFGAINLMASSCSTAALKLASRTTAGSSKTPIDIKRDPDAEGEMDQSNIDLVYQKATAHDMSLDMRSPCEGFELPLRPYQQQGLSWLMKMEGNCEEAREEVSIHPLWEESVP
jgi:DNA repair protein RAD5